MSEVMDEIEIMKKVELEAMRGESNGHPERGWSKCFYTFQRQEARVAAGIMYTSFVGLKSFLV